MGKIQLFTKAEVKEIHGNEDLHAVVIKYNDEEKEPTYVETDYFIPLFGLSPKLGPIGNWDLEIEKMPSK